MYPHAWTGGMSRMPHYTVYAAQGSANRASTFLRVYIHGETYWDYLVGWSENWRPDSQLLALEKMPSYAPSVRCAFRMLVERLQKLEIAPKDWDIRTCPVLSKSGRSAAEKLIVPGQRFSTPSLFQELKGKSLKWEWFNYMGHQHPMPTGIVKISGEVERFLEQVLQPVGSE